MLAVILSSHSRQQFRHYLPFNPLSRKWRRPWRGTPLDLVSQSQEKAAEDDEEDHIFEVNFNTDQYRPCNTKLAHDSLLSKMDTPLTKKTLTVIEARHLDTKALIAKLDEVPKIVDLDVSTILGEQMKDPLFGTVGSWIRRGEPAHVTIPEIQQSKGLLRSWQELNQLLVEAEAQLLCYNEPSDKLDEENIRILLPLSLFLACFLLGHYIEMGGHMGATKTCAHATRFYFWPGIFDWICALTADCFTCQKNKPKHRNDVPLEKWRNDTIPFRSVQIDHQGPLHPSSNRNLHCFLL